MAESLHSVALALTAEDGASLPEMPVLYTGSFEHSGRKFEVTEADLDTAVQNFNAQLAAGTEIPTDFEHGQAEGGIASGWYKALRREGNRLLAKIAWTDKAREQIVSGARRYFSPEFLPAGKDEHGNPVGFKLTAGALVVRPHLKGLGAVALSDDVKAALYDDSQAEPPAPTDAERRADMSDTVSLKDVEELNSKLSEATDQITALSERVTAAETRADDAEAKFAATEKELADERLAAALKQARSEGRIDAKDETTAKFTDLHEKVGLDGVRSLLSMIPAETIPLSATGHGGDKPLELSDAPEGVDPASHKIHLRAEEIASEKDIPYEQAASIAFQEAQV